MYCASMAAQYIGFSAHANPLEVGPSTPYNSILLSRCTINHPSLLVTLLLYKVELLSKKELILIKGIQK